MDDINQRDLIDKSHRVAVNIPQPLISLWEQSPEPWGIKDLESRYLYCNAATLAQLNLLLGFDIKGYSDSEIDHPTAEFASHVYEHDRRVQELQRPILSLDIYPYGNKKVVQPYIYEKFPFYNNYGECVGIVFHGKKLQVFSAMQYINRKLSGLWEGDQPEKLCTEKELDVVFFALQSLRCKEIAKRVDLNYRSVKNKRQALYKKAKVNSLSKFQAFCRKKGFDRYITPQSIILNHGVIYAVTHHRLRPVMTAT